MTAKVIYKPILYEGGHVPWGYERDPDNSDLLQPIQEDLELLNHALKELRPHYSWDDCAIWINRHASKPISTYSLMQRVKILKTRSKKENYYKNIVDRLEDAKKKYEKYQNQIGGSNTFIYDR